MGEILQTVEGPARQLSKERYQELVKKTLDNLSILADQDTETGREFFKKISKRYKEKAFDNFRAMLHEGEKNLLLMNAVNELIANDYYEDTGELLMVAQALVRCVEKDLPWTVFYLPANSR